ncbi:MAG TPA: hypothetical protein VHK89_09240, partial [Actinomycetota bacterium]|nr:hypothetical protein [Actinomycetota bacterium]
SGPALWGAAMVAAALAAVLGGVALRRRTAARRATPGDEAGARARLLEEIAELDLGLRAGEIGEPEWAARRAALKRRLERIPARAPEPAP